LYLFYDQIAEVKTIKEEALVQKGGVNKETVILKKVRPEACGHCHARAVCGVKKEFEFHAVNNTGESVSEGEKVWIELPDISLSKISFLVYGFPVIVLVATLLLAVEVFSFSELPALLMAAVFFFLSFLVLRSYDKRVVSKKKEYRPKVLRKI